MFICCRLATVSSLPFVLCLPVQLWRRYRYAICIQFSYFHYSSGNIPGIELLLDLGSSLEAEDKCRGYTPFHTATALNKVEVMKLFLERQLVGPNWANKEGVTALHVASQSENRW